LGDLNRRRRNCGTRNSYALPGYRQSATAIKAPLLDEFRERRGERPLCLLRRLWPRDFGFSEARETMDSDIEGFRRRRAQARIDHEVKTRFGARCRSPRRQIVDPNEGRAGFFQRSACRIRKRPFRDDGTETSRLCPFCRRTRFLSANPPELG